MKKMMKFAGLFLALLMVLCMSTSVLAQTVDTAKGNATITIPNASKGETYSVVKLFDATVTGKADGSIAYTGTIPDALTEYFEEDAAGNISAKSDELTAEAIAALKAWAEGEEATVSAVADGTALEFTGLEYGYYVLTTTQGTAITVDSTNPNATVYDKNSTTFNAYKNVEEESYSIGDTVSYTTNFPTTNWLGEGSEAQQVYKYVISDTLPAFLTSVNVTALAVDNDGDLETTEDVITLDIQQFDTDKSITVAWIDGEGKSLYNNGAQILLSYTAVLTDAATIDGDGNTNTVRIQPYTDDTTPYSEYKEDSATIYTYAAALLKVDENGAPLAGAKFAAKGLTVKGEAGNYTVVSYDASENAAQGTEMLTDDEGKLIIKGLKAEVSLVLTETAAPAGYNKLVDTVTLAPTIISEEVTAETKTVYYDENGEVTEVETETSKTLTTFNEKLKEAAVKVENKKGSMLPSTGGIGTVLFYVAGSLLVIGAVVMLVVKKRMSLKK